MLVAERPQLVAPADGVSQPGHALYATVPVASTWPSMLPTPLTRKETASAATARPLAPRAERESCAVIAATPVKATPTAAIEAPAASDPPTGWPAAIIAERRERREQQVRAERHGHGRGQRPRSGADHAGAEQLGAPGLFVLARVAHHAQDAHHGGEQRRA